MNEDMNVEPNLKASSKKKKQKRPPKKITENYLHNAGLYYLERFAASKAHFKSVMLRKVKTSCLHHKDQNYEDCAGLVDKLADKFEELGLLNDEAYMRGMVTSLRRRGLSGRAIMMRLSAKGISGEMSKRGLQDHDQDYAETEREGDLIAALTYCRKKKIGPFAAQKTIDNQFEKWLAGLDCSVSFWFA